MQHAVCHVVGRNSTALKFDRAGIAFISDVCHWLKPLTDQGEKTNRNKNKNKKTTHQENQGKKKIKKKTTDDELKKMTHNLPKPKDSSPNRDSNPRYTIGGRLLARKKKKKTD